MAGREKKVYGLKAARKPKEHPLLAGVVAVAERESKGYAYVSFTDALVRDVAKALPAGLSPERPAFLKVRKDSDSRWVVLAMQDRVNGVVLWVTTEKPSWLAKVREARNG